MQKDNGQWLHVELLRSLEWIAESQAATRKTIFLNLAEMGAIGDADVLSIGPCPPIQPGKGNVITGKFAHEVAEGDVVDVRFAGQAEATRVTATHPYWSIDREDFIAAGQLRTGERVHSLIGPTRTESILPSNYSGLVYNLEIQGEHVYRVGSAGLLAHNACQGHHIWPRSWGNHIPYGHKSLPPLSPELHRDVHTAFSDFLFDKFGKRFRSQNADDWIAQLGEKEVAQQTMNRFMNWFTKNHPVENKRIVGETGQTLKQWFQDQNRVLQNNPQFWGWD